MQLPGYEGFFLFSGWRFIPHCSSMFEPPAFFVQFTILRVLRLCHLSLVRAHDDIRYHVFGLQLVLDGWSFN